MILLISVDSLTRVLVRWPQQVFESHRIVFTVGTSVASVLTAWAGTLIPSCSFVLGSSAVARFQYWSLFDGLCVKI